jgi:hypothetical protein
MDKKTVFVKTTKGDNEVKTKSGSLSGDLKRALLLVDEISTFDEVSRRAAPSLRSLLPEIFAELIADGYIRDKAKPFAEAQFAVPRASALESKESGGELDFTSLPGAHGEKADENDVARSRAEVEAAVEAAKIKAKAEAEAKLQASAKQAAEAEARNKLEAEARAKQEAILRAQAEAKAKVEAEARALAEHAAAQAKLQLEATAKALDEAKERARQKIEAVRLKAAQEAARARAELEASAKARAEAEAARIKAEQLAIQIKMEQETAKAKAEAEVKALAQERAKQEIEAARQRAEQDAARIKAEQDAARIKAEAVAKAFAEERAKQEAEAARIKAEQEAARIKAEVEARELAGKRAAQEAEAARVKLELEAVKAKADAEAKALAEERTKQEKARVEAERDAARLKAELEVAKARAEAEARALTEQRARQEAEAARIKAEQDAARIKIEQDILKARASAEAQAKALAAARARQEAEIVRINAENESARKMAESVNWALSQPDPSPNAHSIEFHEKVKDERLDAERILLEHKIAEQEAAIHKANAESQKLAEEQAKAWAAAEQRANVLARAEALRHMETAKEPVKANMQKSVRVRRNAIPVGKIMAGLVIVLLLAVWLVPSLMSLDDYIAPVEKKLSVQFKQPVHIGAMRAELLPLPKLQLQKLSIGSGQEIKISNVILTFDLFSLFSPVKNIRTVELKDVSLDGAALENEAVWLQEVGANTDFKMFQISAQHIKISSAEITLPDFSGDLEITGQGRVGKVIFKSDDGKLDLTIQSVQDRWQLVMNAKAAALPIFPNLKLDELSANGDISAEGANFSGIDAQAYGGFLHGNAKLTWRKGWQLQGRIGAKSIDLDKLFPKFGISGEIQSDSNFLFSGSKLGSITNVQQVDGAFSIIKGMVNNMDIVETVRQGDRQLGRTHFDELTGNFQSNGRGQHIQLLQISSGILSGSGSFDVSSSAQLTGRLSVELKAREGSSSLSLSGTLFDPELRTGR